MAHPGRSTASVPEAVMLEAKADTCGEQGCDGVNSAAPVLAGRGVFLVCSSYAATLNTGMGHWYSYGIRVWCTGSFWSTHEVADKNTDSRARVRVHFLIVAAAEAVPADSAVEPTRRHWVEQVRPGNNEEGESPPSSMSSTNVSC